MIQYFLYKIGMWLALVLPLKLAYALAEKIAVLQYHFFYKDRRAVLNNLKVVTGLTDKKELEAASREVFINFSKYLVDFFRFPEIDKRYIDKFVKIEGEEHLRKAFKKGKGVIALTAHIGNWESAGAITALLGYPVNVIALSHEHKKVNELFVAQRQSKGINVIPLGVAVVRRCYLILKNNELIGLVGDRDFTQGGILMKFLGKIVKMPKGPALFCLKAGAVLVPSFLIRQQDNTYKMIYEEPIEFKRTGNFQQDMMAVMMRFTAAIEQKIKEYPRQWFMFREFWNEEANKVKIR